MRKAKTEYEKLREQAINLSLHLDKAADMMVSGRSFAATEMRRAARLLQQMSAAWSEQDKLMQKQIKKTKE